MKTIMDSILEALFNPKPNDHRRNESDDYQYGQGLILIPVPAGRNNENTQRDAMVGR
jgi:hypothetical protein